MQKFPWSLERSLVVGCIVGLLVLISIASVVSHHANRSSASQASDQDSSTPAETDVPQVLPVGTQGPAFDSTTVDGHPFTSKELTGHVAILDFWATWCGPCQMAIPSLEDLHANYAAQGVQVIGVSMDTDTAQSVKPYMAHMKMNYPVLVNPNQNVLAAQLYNATGLPSIYVLDKHGVVRWSTSGYFPGEEDVVRTVVDRLLKEK